MSADASPAQRRAGTWGSRRAVLATAALVVWIPGCVIACWWQVGVGRAGDALGWVYSVMWPCFAVFGTVFWWHFVHDDPDSLGRRGLQRLQRAPDTVTSGERARVGGDVGRRPHEHRGAHDQADDDAIRRAEETDPELAASTEYLAALARQARPSERRGR